ncbi:MAG: EAL domain-containing protein, partial [Pseudomonadota bacterium]
DELTGYRGVCSDVTDAKAAEAKIAYMAHYDALTKLPNRTTMTTALERAVERSKTAGEQFAVLCVDLDKFKSINDTLGHPAGDTLLRGVANRLIDCVGAHDVVARFGGDEFVVLKTRVEDIDEVEFLGDTIVDALLEPFDLNGQQAMISGSVGIAFAPKDGDSAEVLLKHADLALYRAKSNGRGRTQFFESSMDEEARKRMAVEHDLRRALYEGDELRLHFQPLVHAATTDVIGYEALLRWNRPNGDVVMPSDFIDVAEETGLIVPLGEWVIRQAIQEAAHWTHKANVAVNLSPIQMKNPALISTVVQALAATGLPPKRLELEITESVLMQETDANLKTLHALKDLGVQIALDDFGTGYSSLNYLRAFPFDKIKIDKCFV